MNAQQALSEVLSQRLKNASALWGGRVEPLQIASVKLTKPYVVFFYSAGGRDLVTPYRKNARFVVSVKGVALELATAMAMDDAINGLLDDSGRKDTNPGLAVHPIWDVLNVTEMQTIYLEEMFSGAQSIYHAGHQYEILMEHK